MRASRIAAALLGAAALALSASACEKQPPVPGHVSVAGDSLTFQGNLFDGPGHDWDLDGKVGLGWEAEDAQPRLQADVEGQASPAVLVVALGQNDAGAKGGLSTADRADLSALLNTVHPDARVVLVKPAYLGTSPSRQAGIAAYRSWVDGVIERHPTWVVVDWLPIVQAHPEYLGPDCFHLNVPEWSAWDGQPNPAAVAYLDLMAQGIEQATQGA